MRLFVKVKPQAKVNKIQVKDDSSLFVWVTAPAHEGKANKAVIKLLARHFKVSKSKVLLLQGEKAKVKMFEIVD